MRFLTRLLLLVLTAIVPLVAVEVYTALELQREREREIHSAAMNYVQDVATQVEQVTESIRHLLIATSLAPAVRGDDAEACSRYLREVKLKFAPTLIIAMLNTEGRVRCRSELGPLPQVNNSDRYYFREALRTREFTVGEYTYGRVTGQHAVHMSYPVLGADGEAVGVLAVPVNVDWLGTRVANRSLPEKSSVTLADRNGVVLVRLPERDQVGKRLPDAVLPRLTAAAPATYEGLRVFDDVRRIVAILPRGHAPHGFMIAVALAHDVAMAPVRRALERSAFLIALAVLVAAVAAWAMGRYTLERPVAQLDRAARRWSVGDYTARSGLKGRGELARLGQTFDAMADAIEKRVIERTRVEEDLRRSRDEALQASTSKTNFLAAASHDLRQPLQSMSLTVALLEHRHRDDADAPVIARLAKAIRNLSGLLNTLLDITRLEAGLVKPVIAVVDMGPLMRDIRDDFAASAADKGVSLELETCEASARSDPNLLGRVVRNLVDNALKFTPAGGAVLLACREEGEEVVIEVIDTGIGIPPERQQDVFREFQQVNNPARDPTQGLGLGLAIVERTMRLLDHPLALRSVPGAGTTFTLRVPKAVEGPHGRAGDREEPRVSGRVLLVEDNADVLASTAALLSALGAEVKTATSAEDAERVMNGTRFDAVIADYRLPGASGLEVLKRARERYPGIVAALVKGDPQVERLASAGNDVIVVQKPLTVERLAALVRGAGAAEPPARG